MPTLLKIPKKFHEKYMNEEKQKSYIIISVGINDSQNGGFFGTRIPNPREGEKNSFPRAKPEEKEFFYLPEGLEFLFQKNRHFGKQIPIITSK